MFEAVIFKINLLFFICVDGAFINKGENALFLIKFDVLTFFKCFFFIGMYNSVT